MQTPEGWMSQDVMNASEKNDLSLKQNRLVLLNWAYKMYYLGEWDKCDKYCLHLKDLFGPYNLGKKKIQKEMEELDYMIEKCQLKVVAKQLQDNL